MSEYLDCIAASAPCKVCLVITPNSSLFSSPGRPLRKLISELEAIYGPDFEYKVVTYERNDLK